MVFETITELIPTVYLITIIIISIWDLFWKGFALWFSARRKQRVWFVLLLSLNTAGILPIIYLILHRKKKK